MNTIISFSANLENCQNFSEISKMRQSTLQKCARLEFDPYGQEIIGYDEKCFGVVAELIFFTENGKFKIL